MRVKSFVALLFGAVIALILASSIAGAEKVTLATGNTGTFDSE